MKFTIDSKVFKGIVERAVAVREKKEFVSDYVTIIAEKVSGKVYVFARNEFSISKVYTDKCDIAEGGEMVILADNLTKLFNVSGDVEISTSEETVSADNGKKKSAVSYYAEGNNEIPTPQRKGDLFSVDKGMFLDTLNKFAPIVAQGKEAFRPQYNGFNINSGDRRISVCDGYRAAYTELDWAFQDTFNINIPLRIVKELKKVSANKATENITVCMGKCNGYCIIVLGVDFEYTLRLYESEFLDIDKAVGNVRQGVYTFNFENADEFKAIAKEYSKISDKRTMAKCPMLWTFESYGMLTTFISCSGYQTSDKIRLDKFDVPKDYEIAFNPVYMVDVLELFDDEYTVTTMGKVSPIVLTDGKIKAILLPMRINPELVEEKERFNAA